MTPSGPLPPGPAAGRLTQTLALHRDPVGHLRRCQTQFGDVFTLRTLTAGPLVVVADPARARELAELDRSSAPGGGACAGAARRRLLPMASDDSTFGGDGAAHGAARARIEGAFAPAAVEARRDALAALAAEHVARWPRGRPFRLLARMRTFCDDAFVRHVLRVEDEERAAALVAEIGSMLRTPGNPPTTVPGPRDGLVGRALDVEVRRRRARVDPLLIAELRHRRAGGGADDDVLGRLLAAEPGRDDAALVEELLPNVMAAQEPPAAALTWMLLHLADQGPGAVAAAGGVRPFGEACLRVSPPAVASLRTLTRPIAAGPFDLPAGATVLVPLPLVQNDDRGAELLPFGAGARACLGEALAWELVGALLPAVEAGCRLRPVGRSLERAVLRATILLPVRHGLVVARS